MTHSDDNGFVRHLNRAAHIVILPIINKEEEKANILAYCQKLAEDMENSLTRTATRC